MTNQLNHFYGPHYYEDPRDKLLMDTDITRACDSTYRHSFPRQGSLVSR